jgi:catechol 2,3-dioxygenase-like lactoylglutathione lyase family enzyme
VAKVIVAVVAVLAAGVSAAAQQALPASEHVVGIGHLTLVVNDVERARAFYRDTLGLTIQEGMAGVPGGALSIAFVAPTDADRRAVTRGLQDPGAARVILTVRDLDAALIQARFSGATVLSEGDAAVPLVDEPGVSRAVLIKDPDGFFVQIMQRAGAEVAGASGTEVPGSDGNVVGLTAGLTVDDMDRTMRVFRDALGFDLRRDPEDNDDARLAMMGVFTAFYRRVIATVPGTALAIELIEVHGLSRRLITARPQDPGTAMLGLTVADVGRAASALTAANATVVAADGVPAIVATPDRFFLALGRN